MPFGPTQPVLAAFNHLIAATPSLLAKMSAHAGRRVDVHIAPLPYAQWLVDSSGQLMTPSVQGAPDLSVRGSIARLLAPGLTRAERVSRLAIEGDAAFAADLRSVLTLLDWDAEDDLARMIGDIPARRLAGTAATLRNEGRESVDRVLGSIGEYLAEERKALVSRAQCAALAADTADCAARLDALAGRLAALEARAAGRGKV